MGTTNDRMMSISEIQDPAFELLLEYLKENRAFDFTGYKRSSLTRRVIKRMQTIGIESFSDYMDYLEVHPEEFASLFNIILINVTSFFRDPQVWDNITGEIIPRIIAGKNAHEPIRIWSAGCASGEEAYTLAMILAEALGIAQFRSRVKIYATDLDEEALNYARQASYSQKEIEMVPPELCSKYFEQNGARYSFNKELRHSVIFGRHNLADDAPISRVDLLVCRNTLMYFNAEAQMKILNRFHFALRDGGFLFLGKAEMLLTHTDIFFPVDLKRRVFTKVPRGILLDRKAFIAHGIADRQLLEPDASQLPVIAFEMDPIAQIVIDLRGYLVMMSERARMMFGLTQTDIGRPLQDLEISYRPLELRSRIDQVRGNQRPLLLKDVEWHTPTGDQRWLEVHIIPLIAQDGTGSLMAVKVIFTDVSRYRELQQQLQQSKQELETAYEELQSTNEELVTTNEELQSTNEELETTNEELQSTNEELETINEELQSASEELETINEDLRERGEELDHINAFLGSILASMQGGVVVVNQDLEVQIWNHRAEDLWGLRTGEVKGKALLNLDIGLPLDGLRQVIRQGLAGEANRIMLNAINRRGKAIQCEVTCTPLVGGDRNIRGVILLMDAVEGSHGLDGSVRAMTGEG